MQAALRWEKTLQSANAEIGVPGAGGVWAQRAYVKGSNTEAYDEFGASVALDYDGKLLAVGAPKEDSGAKGVGGGQRDNSAQESGAVYVLTVN